MREVFIDLRSDALFYKREKRVVAETHELALRCDQVMGLPSWLESTERQAPICTVGVFNRTIDRIIGRKRNRHVGQRVDARRPHHLQDCCGDSPRMGRLCSPGQRLSIRGGIGDDRESIGQIGAVLEALQRRGVFCRIKGLKSVGAIHIEDDQLVALVFELPVKSVNGRGGLDRRIDPGEKGEHRGKVGQLAGFPCLSNLLL